MENSNRTKEYIQEYIKVTEQLKDGNYTQEIPIATSGEIKRLGLALQDLVHTLERRYREVQQLDQIASQINAGLLLDDILEQVYQNFHDIIPYNRIGLSLIQADGKIVRACWAKTDQPAIHLDRKYAAPLESSSLQTIIDTGQPRIINDLTEYLKTKPDSKSTRLIIAEGIRSSLTCPLIVNGIPVGFMFFSSIHPDTYTNVHVEIFQKIAAQLSVIVEKGRLVSELADQKEAIVRQHEELHHLYMLQEEYLQQVTRVTQAAADVEERKFTPESLDEVAGRTDALGQLARVFQNMAREVYEREQHLKQQVLKLRIEIDEIQRTEQVKGITESESFRDLKKIAQQLRAESSANDEMD
ncbi:MAG: GAF domain-containing protein [Anaerolineales bacterium]|nr:GAF domain-containing protein [Anaerolineales bacterium]